MPPERPGLGRIPGLPGPQPALGRIVLPDDRDREFPLRAALPKKIAFPRQRSWDVDWIGDQGDTSQCVGYAWHGFLRAAPLRRRKTKTPSPIALYTGAQKNDDWPGESPVYEGSSVRGGAKFVSDVLGGLTEYRWASTVDEVLQWLAAKGPVVFGTDWYRQMYVPIGPLAVVKAEGELDGGHAYLCYGYESKGSVLKFVNSWGRKWGEAGGRFRMHRDTVEKLLAAHGEACVALKAKVVS